MHNYIYIYIYIYIFRNVFFQFISQKSIVQLLKLKKELSNVIFWQ